MTIFLMSCGTNNSNSKLVFQPNVDSLDQEKQVIYEWKFERIEGSKLLFETGEQIETNLHNLEFVGQIPLKNKDPYLIFIGVDCDSCDANSAIYIHSASDGEIIVGNGQNTYGLPGRVFNYENNSLIYEGRAFYGQVLEDKRGVIWYQKTLMETGRWENSTFIAEIKNNKKENHFLSDTGLIHHTLVMLNKGLCKEIKGIDQTSEP
jgi:hypothetical protein